MHNAASDADFIPPALLDGGPRPSHNCASFALSFFESLEMARARYAKLSQRVDAASRYGDHIGEIDLLPTDGLMCDPNPSTGHFDLHPEDGVSLATRVGAYHGAA